MIIINIQSNTYNYSLFQLILRRLQARRNSGRGLIIMKYCRPTRLADKENFSFQIV